MFAYYLLVTIPFLGFLFDKKKRGVAFLSIFFIGLFLLLSLRSMDVGTDLKNYKIMFDSFSEMSWVEIFTKDYEVGYALLNKLVAAFHGSFHAVLVIIAFITVFPFWFLYKEESDYPILIMALVLSVFPFSMLFSGLRQMIAIALVVPAYLATRKRNFLSFILIVILAYLFHQSAIAILALYPIYHIKVKPSWMLLIVPTVLVVLIFNQQIFKLIISLVNERYADSYGEIKDTGSYTMIVLFSVFLAFCFIAPDEKKIDRETQGLRSILVFILFLQLFAPVSSIFMRINYYFIVLIPLLIPKIIKCAKHEYKGLMQVANLVMSVFFIVYFFVNGYSGPDILQIFPYVPIWG